MLIKICRNVSLVFVGLYLIFIARKKLQKTSWFYKIRLQITRNTAEYKTADMYIDYAELP